MTLKQTVKKALPGGDRARTLPLGIGRGLRLTINLREGQISTYLGLYEMELNSHLRRLCPLGARSFDLGGHIGYDALVMAKLSGSDVLTVEADPGYCLEIERNLNANPKLKDRVTVLNDYVGDADEGAVLGSSQVTVDQLAAEFFMPDFIKMDIEGGEVAALRGASHTLTKRRPDLLIEVHSVDLEDQCLDLLRIHGYEPRIVDQRGFLREHRPTPHNRWIVAAGRRLASMPASGDA